MLLTSDVNHVEPVMGSGPCSNGNNHSQLCCIRTISSQRPLHLQPLILLLLLLTLLGVAHSQNPGVNPGVPETVPVSSIENLLQNTQLAQRQQQPEAAAMAAATQQPQQLQQQNDQLVQPQPQPQPQPQAQPQPEAQPQPQPTPAIVRQECADVPISTSQLELANMAELIVTGVVLAAGAGSGVCHPNGTLTPMPDDLSNSAPGGADPPQSPKRPPSNSSFVLVGLQCTHKGLVRCRNNSDDLGDCLVLVEAPVLPDSAPCALTGGQRYMFFLQSEPGPCDGYYYAMFQRAYHTIRRPLGGTGCTFYPGFPAVDDMIAKINNQCSGNEMATCSLDRCDTRVTRSPCANDTTTRCDLKQCAGKFMYYNAIMPSETCYELYTYRTSGLPVNCYGQRYINNRIREIELQQALANATSAAAQVRQGGNAASSQMAQGDGAGEALGG